MVVIPKPNKMSYDNPKLFRPIVLLNTVSKLIEKVIGNRLQFHVTLNSFIYPSQLGGLKFKSTTNAGVVLMHIIRSGWVKNLSTSTLAFDIAQFFPSLNHYFLTLILRKVGFDFCIANFFLNYLIGRKTNYFWNGFTSPSLDVNVGVGQDSALSPILSGLYLLPFLYILEKCLKILKIPISILSFVDDGLLLSQSKSFSISNSHLFCSYNIATILLSKFGLIVEHLKTEVFYFTRSQGSFNPPPLDLSPIGEPILHPKELWKYLGFVYNRKLTFHQHINFYLNKAMSMVKCMKILGNSNHRLIPNQKCLLYQSCVLHIVLYGFQLWYYNHAPLSYPLKMLRKMQRRAALWILGVFKMSPMLGIEAIAGLIPINLHLQKLGGRSQLRSHSLSPNHIIHSFMEPINSSSFLLIPQHLSSLGSLTKCQCELVKGHVVDMNNRFNKVFPSFSPLHPEFAPGNRVIDNFSD